MSIDRRIVSILYYNGITDVEKVEKFLGENGYYYEIIIGGEVKKLKIPGIDYPSETLELEEVEILDEISDETIEDEPIEYEIPIEEHLEKENDFVFPDSIDSAVESAKNQNFTTTVETYTFSEEIKTKLEEIKDTFEDELEKSEIEKKEILEKITEEPVKSKKKKTPKISEKKIKIIESKEIDDDIDDFINTL
jgi:hypothetical protein